MTMTAKHSVDIYRVARQCGVKLFDAHLHSPTSKRPYHCYCKPTVRWIGQAYGEDHLRLVLRLMTGTKQNALHLHADVMKAVARLLDAKPELLRRTRLVDEFNAIDLGNIRSRAKGDCCGVPTCEAATVILALHFDALAAADTLPAKLAA